MDTILDRIAALGAWSFDGFYLPALVWTAVAAAFLLADQRLPLRRPLLRRDLAFVLLFALPVALAARVLLLIPDEAALVSIPVPESFVYEVTSDPALGVTEAPVPSSPPVLLLAAGALLLVLGASVATSLVLYAWHLGRLSALRQSLTAGGAVFDAERARAQAAADRLALEMGTRPVRVFLSRGETGPITFGALQPVVVVPASVCADASALRLALLHELAHVRHGDAALALGHGLAHALMAWHPLARLLGRRLELRAEQACDAAVLADAGADRRVYAQLLSGLTPGAPRLTASMAARPSHLRQRIEAMKQALSLSQSRVAAAGGLVALAAIIPVALGTSYGSAYGTAREGPELLNPQQVASEAMVRYPRIAARAGPLGEVEVRVEVTEEGRAENARVVRSSNAAFDELALLAVPEARFRWSGPGRTEQTLLFYFGRPGSPAIAVTTPGQPVPVLTGGVQPPRVVGVARPLTDASEVKQPPEPASAAPLTSTPPNPDPAMNRTQRLLAAAALAAAMPAAAQTTSPAPAPSPPQVAIASQNAPVPLTTAAPEWPAEARRDSIEGRVMLNVHVGADGRVIETQPLRFGLRHAGSGAALPPGSSYEAAFATAAGEAAMRWTFTPAMRRGEPVAAWMALPMHFQMPNGTIETAKTACAVPADVRPGSSSREAGGMLLNHWSAAPGAGGTSTPATPTDRPWLECLTVRLSENAVSEEVRTYRAYAVATLAQLGGR